MDLAELARKPQRSFFPDPISQHLWMAAGHHGTLKLFGYDMLNNGRGRFRLPADLRRLPDGADRPEIIFADESGNLFVYDPTNQQDTMTPRLRRALSPPTPPAIPSRCSMPAMGMWDSGGVHTLPGRHQRAGDRHDQPQQSRPAQGAHVGLLCRTVKGSRWQASP